VLSRYCANCGTEVDETAAFCPTCGQPLDEAAQVAMPPASTWPDESTDPSAPMVAQPLPPPPAPLAPPPAPSRPPVELPVSLPVTLSGWLIGVGATLAAVGMLIGLIAQPFGFVDLVALVALAGVAASIFAASALPAIPHLRLATLAVALIVFGVSLDRIAAGGMVNAGWFGAGMLLTFLGSAAAGIGAILVELGRDQPLGAPGA
jgi:hypothetical protein